MEQNQQIHLETNSKLLECVKKTKVSKNGVLKLYLDKDRVQSQSLDITQVTNKIVYINMCDLEMIGKSDDNNDGKGFDDIDGPRPNEEELLSRICIKISPWGYCGTYIVHNDKDIEVVRYIGIADTSADWMLSHYTGSFPKYIRLETGDGALAYCDSTVKLMKKDTDDYTYSTSLKMARCPSGTKARQIMLYQSTDNQEMYMSWDSTENKLRFMQKSQTNSGFSIFLKSQFQ